MTFCLPDLLTNRMADGPLDRETDRLVFKWIAQFIDCFFFLLRGSCIQTLKGHKDNVNCIHVDSTRIISVSYDQRVRVWDFNSWPQQQSLNKETIYCSKMHSFWVFLFQKIDYLILCYTSLYVLISVVYFKEIRPSRKESIVINKILYIFNSRNLSSYLVKIYEGDNHLFPHCKSVLAFLVRLVVW